MFSALSVCLSVHRGGNSSQRNKFQPYGRGENKVRQKYSLKKVESLVVKSFELFSVHATLVLFITHLIGSKCNCWKAFLY